MSSLIPSWTWPEDDEFTVIDTIDGPEYRYGPPPSQADAESSEQNEEMETDA